MKTKFLVFAILLSSVFISCSSDKLDRHYPDVSSIEVDLKVNRIDKELFELTSKDQIKEYIAKNPLFFEQVMAISQYPSDTIVINDVYRLITDPAIDTLRTDCNAVFGDFEDIKKELTLAFKHIKYYYPDFIVPEIYTAITGFGFDLVVEKEFIVIGLDYFVGRGSKYRPNSVPGYILDRLQKEYITSSIVTILGSKYFTKTNMLENTMLSEMVGYGKIFEFTKQMIPNVEDSLVIGYTTEELKITKENLPTIWGHFVEYNLFFSTSREDKTRYIAESPKVYAIGDNCPGRIGRWLGWQIVQAYREKSDVDFKELMENDNSEQIFKLSKFKPKMN